MLLGIKISRWHDYIINLLPNSFVLNCTKCRLSKVTVHFTKYFRLLVDPRGTNKKPFFPVGVQHMCNADISAHLSSCHLSKCGDVAEAELIMARAGIRGMLATQFTGTHYYLPKAQTLAWNILATAKVMRIPWAYWESLAGKHVISFQMVDEICFRFGKTITAVGSRKCNISFQL